MFIAIYIQSKPVCWREIDTYTERERGCWARRSRKRRDVKILKTLLSFLFLVKENSPTIYGSKVRILRTAIFWNVTHTARFSNSIYSSLLFSLFSSIVDPSRSRSIRSKPPARRWVRWLRRRRCMSLRGNSLSLTILSYSSCIFSQYE